MGWVMMQNPWRLCVQISGLIVCYFFAGQLGHWQAIPPGYATAISPASGIALAGLLLFGYRAWPGVLIGSFLANVGTAFDRNELATSLLLPLGIAAGAMLQALAGAALVRRLVGVPNLLNQEADVAKFLIVAVPLSCLCNATIGALLLWWTRRIQWEEFAFNWWTWWVGDTIGAFVVAPLILVWTAQPQPDWPRRPITVTLPLGILSLLVVSLFVVASDRDKEHTDEEFKLQTETLTRAIENRVDYVMEALNGMRHDHGKNPSRADQDRFIRAARTIKARRETVNALSWLPRIVDAERDAFESAGKEIRGADFCIRESGPNKSENVCAGQRSEYYPVLYREPTLERPQSNGFDVASDSELREALKQAAGSAVPFASPPRTPAQSPAAEKTVLIYLPIYRDGVAPDDIADRHNALVGYVVAVVRLKSLADLAWEDFNTTGIEITITDETTQSPQELLRLRTSAAVANAEAKPASADLFQRRTTIEAAGRRWTLRFMQTPGYLAAHRSLQAWSVLAGGMLFTGMLGGVLLVVTGRAAVVTALVEERTAELANANAILTQEIHVRQRAEDELKQSEERFRLLVDGTTDYAIFMLDPQGKVVSWNAGAERIQKYQAEEIIGKHYSCFYTEEDRLAGMPQTALDAATSAGRCETEGWRMRKDGTRMWAHTILTSLRDARGRLMGFSKITRDLTERRLVEAALEESRRLVERIAEMVPSILYVYDLKEKRNVFVNNRIQALLGYSGEESVRQGSAILRDHLHPDDVYQIERANEQYQVVEDDAIIESEFRLRHANGEWRWLHSYETIFSRDDDGSPRQILGMAQDITEHKRLEQEVLDIAAQEQRRIGQELHDGTGQELTGLCMLADSLADAMREIAPEQAHLARRIAQALRQALAQVRALSRGLIPVEVDAEGLMAALSDLSGRIGELNGIRCVFECVEPVPVEDNHTATQLYRIAQEAITNALKHGKAANIRVSLETKERYTTLKITDDGVGLPAAETITEGMGLRIMRYRSGQIGAELSVRPGPLGGAVVTCTLFRGDSYA